MPDAGDRDTVNLNVLADRTCRYDLDEVDVAWLKVINEERYWQGRKMQKEYKYSCDNFYQRLSINLSNTSHIVF